MRGFRSHPGCGVLGATPHTNTHTHTHIHTSPVLPDPVPPLQAAKHREQEASSRIKELEAALQLATPCGTPRSQSLSATPAAAAATAAAASHSLASALLLRQASGSASPLPTPYHTPASKSASRLGTPGQTPAPIGEEAASEAPDWGYGAGSGAEASLVLGSSGAQNPGAPPDPGPSPRHPHQPYAPRATDDFGEFVAAGGESAAEEWGEGGEGRGND